MSQILRCAYYVFVMLYKHGWYLFQYQWREETHSYTLAANIYGYRAFNIENPGTGLQKLAQDDDPLFLKHCGIGHFKTLTAP